VLVLYTVLFLGLMFGAQTIDYAVWREIFALQWMKLATLLALVSIYLHAWVGVRNILMDYVKPNAIRFVLFVVVICWLVACAGWSVQILWSV
jgi:succinate dehydrogenase / fumarate reductase, membrane anchor subunit